MRTTLFTLTFGIALALVVFVAFGCSSGGGTSVPSGTNRQADKGAADGGHNGKGNDDDQGENDDKSDGGDDDDKDDGGDDDDDKDEADH